MILSDRVAVALALAAVVGAVHPSGVALVGGVLLVAARAARSPWALVAATGLVVSGLAQRSLDGLDGVTARPFAGEVVLVGDPEPSFGGVRADVRVGGRRLEARADGTAAGAFADRLAGEVLRVRGVVEPAPAGASWLIPRHVAGRLTIARIEDWRPGDAPSRLANSLRRTLVTGADSLSERQRSLYTGLVIGDDRTQPADLADDFLGAGLTHLLAVSGQNVAFALAMAGPVLRRVRLWPRLVVTLGVIGLFGVMTRFEPSVLRASAMAALAAVVVTVGHPAARVRVIALAVVGLLVVDPLLVLAVGFRLSLAAAVAIVVLAPRIGAVLPGPAWLREPLAVTVAAQLGVAPVLLATFGPLPVASLPANLLAVPVAGAVMVWGLTAGLAAGIVGGVAAAALHLPTRLGLSWLELVAHRSAQAPLGELRGAHVVAVGAGLAWAGLGSRPSALVRQTGLAVAAGAVAVAVLAAQTPAPLRSMPTAGVTVWSGGSTHVVVLGGAGAGRSVGTASVLEGLRRSGVRAVAVVVRAEPSVPAGVVEAVVDAHPTGLVVAADSSDLAMLNARGVAVARAPARPFVVGALEVRITAVPGRLVVEARPVSEISALVGFPRASSSGRGGVHRPAESHGRGRFVARGADAVAGGGRRPLSGGGARRAPLRRPVPGPGHGDPEPHARLVLRPGHLLRLRCLPAEGRAARGRRRRPPRRGRGEGGAWP